MWGVILNGWRYYECSLCYLWHGEWQCTFATVIGDVDVDRLTFWYFCSVTYDISRCCRRHPTTLFTVVWPTSIAHRDWSQSRHVLCSGTASQTSRHCQQNWHDMILVAGWACDSGRPSCIASTPVPLYIYVIFLVQLVNNWCIEIFSKCAVKYDHGIVLGDSLPAVKVRRARGAQPGPAPIWAPLQ